jgi:glycyl-tRNA synthetase beta chain
LSPVSGELLLELLSEEIPARMQRRAIADLKTHLDEWLQAIASEEWMQSTAMSRRGGYRHCLWYSGTATSQKRRAARSRVGSPRQAIDGFCAAPVSPRSSNAMCGH